MWVELPKQYTHFWIQLQFLHPVFQRTIAFCTIGNCYAPPSNCEVKLSFQQKGAGFIALRTWGRWDVQATNKNIQASSSCLFSLLYVDVCVCVCVGSYGTAVAGSGLSLLCRDPSTICQPAPGLFIWSYLMKNRCFPRPLLPSRTSPASSRPFCHTHALEA